MKYDEAIAKGLFPSYQVDKTISTGLVPVGRTAETIAERFLEDDVRRANLRPDLIVLLDAEHRKFIQEKLSAISPLDWDSLEKLHGELERSKGNDKLKKDAKTRLSKQAADFRKKISSHFRSGDSDGMFSKEKTPSELISHMIEECKLNGTPVPEELVAFERFSTYLGSYQEARLNMYSADDIPTSIAHRIVDENFPTFLQGKRRYGYLKESYPEIIKDVEAELASELGGKTLDSMFETAAFGNYISQKGIDLYNMAVNGISKEDGTKLRGINEFVNLLKQRDPTAASDKNLRRLMKLRKQILSPGEGMSFAIGSFDSDEETLKENRRFFDLVLNGDENMPSVINTLESLLAGTAPDDGIRIPKSGIIGFSKMLLGERNALRTRMEEYAENMFSGEKTAKRREKAIRSWLNADSFGTATLGKVSGKDVSEAWRGESARKMFSEARLAMGAALEIAPSPIPLSERSDVVETLRKALDSAKNVSELAKMFGDGNSEDSDPTFYDLLEPANSFFAALHRLRTKTQAYVNMKPEDKSEEIRLTFNNPSLGLGWDKNKEKDFSCGMLKRNGEYFLTVIPRGSHVNLFGLAQPGTSDPYMKMTYKALNAKTLFGSIFSEKRIAEYGPDPDLVKEYRSHSEATKSGEPDEYDEETKNRLIDYCKRCIASNPDWKIFGFKFKPSSEYPDMKSLSFCDDVNSQGFHMSFDEEIPAHAIDGLVETGNLLLFKISGKDFNPGSTGKPNLFTMYFRALFSDENCRDNRIRLDGGAKIFYRRKLIQNPYVHKVGEKIVNRTTADGIHIPDAVHKELLDFHNGLLEKGDLSPEALAWEESGKATVKTVAHPITKDRRYTVDSFKFSFPITLNRPSAKKPYGFNDAVRRYLASNPDATILSMDRGERNIVYVCVMDRSGRMLLQRSLNMMNGVDYRKLISRVECELKESQRKWATKSKVADIKEGYYSNVVSEICKLVLEHNSIVVLEDLNDNVKKREAAIYKNFEKALVRKLGCLVLKDRRDSDVGGSFRPYQLADKFESLEKIYHQSGIVFWVKPSYTSKIDPATGWSNLFSAESGWSWEKIREFLLKFGSISYDPGKDAFVFEVSDYSRFGKGSLSPRKSWTLVSATRRTPYAGKLGKRVETNPTQETKDAFATMGVPLKGGVDLLGGLRNTPSKKGVKADPVLVRGWTAVFHAFRKTIDLRVTTETEDYIDSPAEGPAGTRFDSRTAGEDMPKDADANGAYHIGLKGLMLLGRIDAARDGKPDLCVGDGDWFAFAQDRAASKAAEGSPR